MQNLGPRRPLEKESEIDRMTFLIGVAMSPKPEDLLAAKIGLSGPGEGCFAILPVYHSGLRSPTMAIVISHTEGILLWLVTNN